MLALPVEPLSKRGKGDIRDKRSYRGSSRGGWWRAKEDVTLDREHQDPEDGRAETADGIDRLRPSQVHDHSSE